jgi:hypothetical protein
VKYNVQFCLNTCPNAVPGISIGLFNSEQEAQAAVQGIEEALKYMRIPVEGHGNPVTWYEAEEEE